MASLAVELAQLLSPDGLARLAADHIDDGHGHCRVCPAGAIGTGRKVWLCDLAIEVRAAAQTTSPPGRPAPADTTPPAR